MLPPVQKGCTSKGDESTIPPPSPMLFSAALMRFTALLVPKKNTCCPLQPRIRCGGETFTLFRPAAEGTPCLRLAGEIPVLSRGLEVSRSFRGHSGELVVRGVRSRQGGILRSYRCPG